jgi:hypothetical protein
MSDFQGAMSALVDEMNQGMEPRWQTEARYHASFIACSKLSEVPDLGLFEVSEWYELDDNYRGFHVVGYAVTPPVLPGP